MRRRTALAVVVASAACFATLAPLARFAYAQGGRPLPILVWRFGIASACMAAFLVLRRPGTLSTGLRDLPRYAALALTGYGAGSLAFFFALKYAPVSVVTVLLFTYPAMVALLHALGGGERLTRPRMVALAATLGGCTLVVGLPGAHTRVSPVGVGLALGAAIGYALFTLLTERTVSARPRLVTMTYTFGISAVSIAAVALFTGESLSPASWTLGLWGIITLVVALPTLSAVALFMRGVRELGAPRAALISSLEPLFTIALAAVFLGERLTGVQAIGAVLVVGGIAISDLSDGQVRGMV